MSKKKSPYRALWKLVIFAVAPIGVVATGMAAVKLLLEQKNLAAVAGFYIAIGILMNLLVVWANGGKMPAPRDFCYAKYGELSDPNDWIRHTILTPETRLKFLADKIEIGILKWEVTITPGDILWALGLILILLSKR